jgi:hypothetical protein
MTMTTTQKTALKMLAKDNTGALYVPSMRHVNGGWIFPEAIRNSEEVAEAVVARLERAKVLNPVATLDVGAAVACR